MGGLFHEVRNGTMNPRIYDSDMGALLNEVTNRTILTQEFTKIIWRHIFDEVTNRKMNTEV